MTGDADDGRSDREKGRSDEAEEAGVVKGQRAGRYHATTWNGLAMSGQPWKT